MTTKPLYTCQVCGKEDDPEIVTALTQFGYEYWVVHRLERVGGIVQVLTCPACASLTEELIFRSYQERIRHGLVPGIH